MALKLKIGLLYSLCLLKMPFKLDKKLMAVKSIKKIKDLLRNTCQSIALRYYSCFDSWKMIDFLVMNLILVWPLTLPLSSLLPPFWQRLSGASLLVFANKQDIQGALSPGEIAKVSVLVT